MSKVKNKIRAASLIIVVLSGVIVSPCAYSEGSGWFPEVSVESAFLTKYIWRGQNLGDDPVVQSGVSVSKWGFTASVWENYDTGASDKITELDYTADYTFNVGEAAEKTDIGSIDILVPLSISVGYTYYTFPNLDRDSDAFDSHEIYLGCSYDVILKPSFTWYRDVDQGHGSYYQAGLSHSFEFESGIAAALGMTAAYNDGQWTDSRGWSDMVFSGSANIPLLKYFTVTPSVAYSFILERDTYNDAQENEFYGGVTIGFEY